MKCICKAKRQYKKTAKGHKLFHRGDTFNWAKCPPGWEVATGLVEEPDAGLDDGTEKKATGKPKAPGIDFENCTREEMYEQDKDWTKDQLEAYCKEKLNTDIDKRKTKPDLIDSFLHLRSKPQE